MRLFWFLLSFLLLSTAACRTIDKQPTEPALAELPQEETRPGESMIESDTSSLPAGFDSQGHRGARGLKPENTLPAFETALDLGVSTLELDLHFSADQEVVVWHDPKIDKVKSRLDPDSDVETRDPDSLVKWGSELMVSQLTLDQLQAYICDRNPDVAVYRDQENSPTTIAGDDYRILTLAELFEFVEDYAASDLKSEAQRENARHVRFNIETKRKPDNPKFINDGFDGHNPGPFELEILHLIEEYGLGERVTVQSFDHRSLWAIRSVNEDINLSALTYKEVPDFVDIAGQGATIWSPRYKDVNPMLIKKAHEAGLLVIPWTVNEASVMLDLIAMGVDGIISDRPDILLDL